MAITTLKERFWSLRATGAFGIPKPVRAGLEPLGARRPVNAWTGIYAEKDTRRGKQVCKMRWYRPTNPRTEIQQTWRAVFTAGFAHWRALTPDQKQAYNKRAYSLKMTGFNLHQREWLNNHKRGMPQIEKIWQK